MPIKLTFQLFVLLLSCIVLNSCGFRLRNTQAIPLSLRTLYLETTHESEFTMSLTHLLRSQNIQLVKSAKNAHYTLIINDNYVSAFSAIAVSTQLNVTATLINTSQQAAVSTKNISLSHLTFLNNNQVMTTYVSESAKQQLAYNAVNLIYDWLTSQEIHRALTGNSHAN